MHHIFYKPVVHNTSHFIKFMLGTIHLDLAITTDRKGHKILPVPKLSVPTLCSVAAARLNPCFQICKAQLILYAFFLMGFGQFWWNIQLGPFKHGCVSKSYFLWGYLEYLNEISLTFGKYFMKTSGYRILLMENCFQQVLKWEHDLK